MKYYLEPNIPNDEVWEIGDTFLIGLSAAREPAWAEKLAEFDRERLLQEQQE